MEAWTLIEKSFLPRLTLIALDESDYLGAIKSVALAGRTGGAVYDALHVAAAQKGECERIYTYNLRHFEGLCPEEIILSAP